MKQRQVAPSSIRVARPVTNLEVTLRFYVDLIGLEHLGGFRDHDGYSGVFVGREGDNWHLEFTTHLSGLPRPTPTDEDLLVLYLTRGEVAESARTLAERGLEIVTLQNPYWSAVGAMAWRDPDGYLIVLCPHAE